MNNKVFFFLFAFSFGSIVTYVINKPAPEPHVPSILTEARTVYIEPKKVVQAEVVSREPASLVEAPIPKIAPQATATPNEDPEFLVCRTYVKNCRDSSVRYEVEEIIDQKNAEFYPEEFPRDSKDLLMTTCEVSNKDDCVGELLFPLKEISETWETFLEQNHKKSLMDLETDVYKTFDTITDPCARGLCQAPDSQLIQWRDDYVPQLEISP